MGADELETFFVCEVSMRYPIGLLVIVLAATSARAETAYPMLMSIKPIAAQIGQTSEHTIRSRYTMAGAYQVLVTGTGVTGEVVPQEMKPEDAKNIENQS